MFLSKIGHEVNATLTTSERLILREYRESTLEDIHKMSPNHRDYIQLLMLKDWLMKRTKKTVRVA